MISPTSKFFYVLALLSFFVRSAFACCDGPPFFVSTSGSDSNPGTITQPFLTIAHATAAMQASSTKLTYIRAGTYTLTANAGSSCGHPSAILLTGSDAGEAFIGYPPDGVGVAVIDGGGTNNTGFCVFAASSTPILIENIQIQNFTGSGIVTLQGPTTIRNNIIHDIGYPTPADNGGPINLQRDAQNSIVSHNYIYNAGNIGVQTNAYSSGTITGLVYEGNFVDNVCKGVTDCGGLYTIDQNTPPSTNITIKKNYVRNSNVGGTGAIHIYMDLGASNTNISGNVLTGFGRTCIHQNSGINNIFDNNICDLSDAGKIITEYQGNLTAGSCTPPACGDMSGMTYRSNIFVSGGGGGTYAGNGPGVLPTISNNVYHQYAGAVISSAGTGGMAGDPTPQLIDPQLNCWAYNLTLGSPVFSAPINFPAQLSWWGVAGFWGPPNFVVPQTGTVPSQPHVC